MTDSHKRCLAYLRTDPAFKEISNTARQSLEWVREGAQRQDGMVDMLQSLQRAAALLDAKYGFRHPVADIEIDAQVGPITFWDQRCGKKPSGTSNA